jgi:hypothetical protein
MQQKEDSVLPEVEQFKMKGRELLALALAIVAHYDERELLPRSPILKVRHRAIILLEGSISFVEFFLRLQDSSNGGTHISK